MTADWTRDYFRPGETDSEHAERVEAAIAEVQPMFDRATAVHADIYHDTLHYLAPLRGPFAERARANALRKFREATKREAALFTECCIEIMQTGEVSPETGDKWSALEAANKQLQAAE